MTTYIPTSASSKISKLDVLSDGSGLLTYRSGSHRVSAVRVYDMLAGAAFQISPLHDYRAAVSPLDRCPARGAAAATGSVGCTYTDGSGEHVYDRAASTCSICSPSPVQELDAAVELNRVMAFELIRAATALAASPNDIELVDAAVAAAKAIERTVYGG